MQLLATFSRLAILPKTESGAGVRAVDDVPAVDAVRRDDTELPVCFGATGLANCFGASTVTGGRAEPAVICDTAGPHSKTVDRTARAEGAAKLGDNRMT
ncbi:hypothetical protein AXW67_30305 [Bradyrhizobium neotropicale]|uniref:Uncharacterized protein n=1 Tax=Bradyrhizobium neotropicale TaxID=1497615 RepID=A0A176YMM6_9BRAD|nr:hypothetical protein AXW67_30305 [Bradyrhizobium neotropicale]